MTDNYREQIVYLSNQYDEIDGHDFYSYIFPNNENQGELLTDFSKPNAVYLYQDAKDHGTKRRLRRRVMLNDTWEDDYMEYVEGNPSTLCSGLSYRGRANKIAKAQRMNALVFDLDGVGGIELGFKQAGIDTIWANEMDKNVAITYRLNHNHDLIVGDISKIKSIDIPDSEIILAGFPCQAFSIAGYRKGFEDERGNIFFQLARVIRDKKPKIVFIENVKNLISHDKGNTYRVISATLSEYGYKLYPLVLNASEYGNIPQNRERIYIIGFRDEGIYNKFIPPLPIELKTKIHDIVDINKKVDPKYYYTKDKCSFYDELKININNFDTLYQWRRVYVRENKSQLCPTLTANMGTGGHNVPLILTNHGIRKLTPEECFKFQGFPDNFKIPDMAQSHLYKQAGNSVAVPVIKRLAESIIKASSL